MIDHLKTMMLPQMSKTPQNEQYSPKWAISPQTTEYTPQMDDTLKK